MKTNGLKIGEIIYSYNRNILEYKVIEIQKLETEGHKEKFFILECLACRGHTKCKVATKVNNLGNLEYSHMVNNYEEDEDSNEHYRNSQYYWHTGDNFFKTRTEARLFVLNKNKSFYLTNISKAEDSIKYNNKCLLENEEKIKSLNDLKDELEK